MCKMLFSWLFGMQRFSDLYEVFQKRFLFEHYDKFMRSMCEYFDQLHQVYRLINLR